MGRTSTAVVVAVLAVTAASTVGLAAAGTVGMATPAADAATTPGSGSATVVTNGTDDNGSVAPGARLAGVIGVQEAELRGEVASRTFGIAVARAATNRSRAAVVAERVHAIRDRLRALGRERAELRDAYRNGTITRGEYRARLATLAAEARTTKRLANRSANASAGLPADLLERTGVNATAITRLKRDASTLTGPEVARIARSIAGRGVGAPMGSAPPVARGPPAGVPGRGIDDASAGRGPPADAGRNASGPTGAPPVRGNASNAGGSRNGSAGSDAGAPDDAPGRDSDRRGR